MTHLQDIMLAFVIPFLLIYLFLWIASKTKTVLKRILLSSIGTLPIMVVIGVSTLRYWYAPSQYAFYFLGIVLSIGISFGIAFLFAHLFRPRV